MTKDQKACGEITGKYSEKDCDIIVFCDDRTLLAFTFTRKLTLYQITAGSFRLVQG